MMAVLALAVRSAWNRRLTLGMTLAAIALSVTLLIGIERVRNDARDTFSRSVSGTDLVVGARASGVQLMLYAVFRIGDATNNMRWSSYRMLADHALVDWAIPVSLGDSHRGFPVLGTTPTYFEHFRFGESQPLVLAHGKPFAGVFDAVLGAEVAERLGYRVGDAIVLNHGSGDVSLMSHADKPFTVTGVLARTGTAVDRTVHVSLEAIEAIHLDWQGGVPIPGVSIPPEFVRKFDLAPKEVTAVLVGLKNRADVFTLQRQVNRHAAEPLAAVLPGVALDDLWQIVGVAERTLLAISAMVVAVGLTGLVAVILSGLGERRRELAILRAVGARPVDILALLTLEGVFITLLGIAIGLLLLAGVAAVIGPFAEVHYGIFLRPQLVSGEELQLLALVLIVGVAASLVPGYRAYRYSLADGLTPRI